MLYDLFMFSPLLIATAAVLAARRVSKGRWLIHLCAIALMVSALPMFVWATHEREPEPGDGLAVVFHLFLLISTLVFYAAYAFVTGRASRLTTADS